LACGGRRERGWRGGGGDGSERESGGGISPNGLGTTTAVVWVGVASRKRACFVGEGFILWCGLGSWVTSSRYVIVFRAMEMWGHLAERLFNHLNIND
jgi:hypothetical protein